jgi:hypothetical protein
MRRTLTLFYCSSVPAEKYVGIGGISDLRLSKRSLHQRDSDGFLRWILSISIDQTSASGNISSFGVSSTCQCQQDCVESTNFGMHGELHHTVRLMDPPQLQSNTCTSSLHDSVLHPVLPYHREGALVLAEISQTHAPTNTIVNKVFTCSVPCYTPSIHPWNEKRATEESHQLIPSIRNHGRSSSCTLGDRRSRIDRRPSRSRRIHGFPTHNAPQGNIQTDCYSTG